MPGRNWSLSSGNRWGYQGLWAEDETESNRYNNFDLRHYDSRIGRFLSIDPYGQYYSPYVGMGNNPINYIDPSGGWTSSSPWLNFYSVLSWAMKQRMLMPSIPGVDRYIMMSCVDVSAGLGGSPSVSSGGGGSGGGIHYNYTDGKVYTDGKIPTVKDVNKPVPGRAPGIPVVPVLSRNPLLPVDTEHDYDIGSLSNNSEPLPNVSNTDLIFGRDGGIGVGTIASMFGAITLGYDYWSNTEYVTDLYIPQSGLKKGLPRSVWRLTNSGNIATRNGSPIPNSIVAANKISLNKIVKGTGIIGNSLGLVFTGIDIANNGVTVDNSLNSIFGIITFIPGYGWAISGSYQVCRSFLDLTIYNTNYLIINGINPGNPLFFK